MNLLITGGCGFLGSNLAAHAISLGWNLTILDNLSRVGSAKNLEWLQSLGKFNFVSCDIRNKNDVETIIKNNHFDAVFHLAGQVAMTTSIENPYKDFETNALGTVNLLDSIRKYSKNTAILYSSTNKVYGDLEYLDYKNNGKRYYCEKYPNGFNESLPLDFHSPYGCSKGCADQYMLDFHRIFGLKTVVFRHSSMYGSRQYATYDQGWVGWFVSKAIEKKNNPNCKPFTISGDGMQVRDILNAEDMVRLYFSALQNIDKIAGNAFNIGGNMNQSLSLLELFDLLNKKLDIVLQYTHLPPRESDQKIFVADSTKAYKMFGWRPMISTEEGIRRMISWVNKCAK